MNSYGLSDKGAVRRQNQDSFVIESSASGDAAAVVVCDGMGGAKAGDFASKLASKEFVSGAFEALSVTGLNSVRYNKLLSDSCDAANGVVYQYSHFDSEFEGMGTTLVGGIVTKHRAYLVNVGDSRAYHLTKKGIAQISRDHSYVQELVDAGVITKLEARNHPKKNIITRALGIEKSVANDFFSVPLKKGEGILLCSDGLTNMVSDAEIYKAFSEHKDPHDVCKRLMELALSRSARDNVTLVLVKP